MGRKIIIFCIGSVFILIALAQIFSKHLTLKLNLNISSLVLLITGSLILIVKDLDKLVSRISKLKYKDLIIEMAELEEEVKQLGPVEIDSNTSITSSNINPSQQIIELDKKIEFSMREIIEKLNQENKLPLTFRNSIKLLRESKVLDSQFALSLIKFHQIRNQVIHDRTELDDETLDKYYQIGLRLLELVKEKTTQSV